MTRNIITGTVNCDQVGCRNFMVNGTQDRLDRYDWTTHASPFPFISNYHYCPTHSVQNSGQEESTMTKVTSQQAKDFLAVRDVIIAIMTDYLYVGTERLADMESFKNDDFTDVATEIMTRFNIELPPVGDQAEF